MNIALFSDSYLPTKSGIVTVVIQLKKILEELGHHVVVVTVSAQKDYLPPDMSMEQNVLRVKSVKSPAGDGQFFGLPSNKKIVAFLKEHDIEIIHAHTEFSMGHAAVKAGRTLGIPVIASTHTMWEDYYRYYLFAGSLIPKSVIRKVVRAVYKDFYAFINVSEKARNYFKEPFMLPEIPSTVIPNATDGEKFASSLCTPEDNIAMREKFGIKKDDFVMLYVGRVVQEKRLSELFDIAASVVKQRKNVKAVFVGSGAMEKPLRERCKKLGLEKSIIFTGFIDWTKLYAYYSMADVFITASLSEMHSMTILEALILGKAVVCRKDTSFTDTIFNGVNGYFADTDIEMHSILLGLSENKKECERLGKAGAEVSRNFTLLMHGKRSVAFYKKVLEKFPRPVSDEELRVAVLSAGKE